MFTDWGRWKDEREKKKKVGPWQKWVGKGLFLLAEEFWLMVAQEKHTHVHTHARAHTRVFRGVLWTRFSWNYF